MSWFLLSTSAAAFLASCDESFKVVITPKPSSPKPVSAATRKNISRMFDSVRATTLSIGSTTSRTPLVSPAFQSVLGL